MSRPPLGQPQLRRTPPPLTSSPPPPLPSPLPQPHHHTTIITQRQPSTRVPLFLYFAPSRGAFVLFCQPKGWQPPPWGAVGWQPPP
ncbi:hypothetical protein Tco_0071192 [Tanacetum coccineum]